MELVLFMKMFICGSGLVSCHSEAQGCDALRLEFTHSVWLSDDARWWLFNWSFPLRIKLRAEQSAGFSLKFTIRLHESSKRENLLWDAGLDFQSNTL